MRAGGRFLAAGAAAAAITGAVLLGGCASESGPAAVATDTTADPVAFCRIVADLNGSDPFAELASAQTKAEADAVVSEGMARIERLRDAAPTSVHGRTERYVTAFEDFELLMHETGYDPDPRDYAALQTRTTTARRDFTAAAEAVCGGRASRPTAHDRAPRS